jgi:hypothetical protein
MSAALRTPSEFARPLYEQQTAMLGELAEMGLDLARTAKADAQAEGVAPADRAWAFAAFAKAARATRLSLMLQAKVLQTLDGGEQPNAGSDDPPEPRITRITRIIVNPDGNIEYPEQLAREAHERLDREAADRMSNKTLSRPGDPSPQLREGGRRSLTDEGARQPVGFSGRPPPEFAADSFFTPSSVGPQADTFSREGRRGVGGLHG